MRPFRTSKGFHCCLFHWPVTSQIFSNFGHTITLFCRHKKESFFDSPASRRREKPSFLCKGMASIFATYYIHRKQTLDLSFSVVFLPVLLHRFLWTFCCRISRCGCSQKELFSVVIWDSQTVFGRVFTFRIFF